MTPHDEAWEAQYAAAWQEIADGLGTPLDEHLPAARRLVGDLALLALFDRFDPFAVIIACGIGQAQIVLGEITRRFSNGHVLTPLERAVEIAHAAYATTRDGAALVAEVMTERDAYERGFLREAAHDPRLAQMRDYLNAARQRDGWPPL